MKNGSMLKLILIFLAGTGIGGAVVVFAMSLVAASKVGPPTLVKDKNTTVNRNKADETANSDED